MSLSQPSRPNPLGLLDLHGDRDDRLGRGPASLSVALDPADIRLVDLDVTRQPLTTGTNHRHPITVQHRPRGLVAIAPAMISSERSAIDIESLFALADSFDAVDRAPTPRASELGHHAQPRPKRTTQPATGPGCDEPGDRRPPYTDASDRPTDVLATVTLHLAQGLRVPQYACNTKLTLPTARTHRAAAAIARQAA